MSKGRPLAVIPPVVVVYRKREKGKAYMSVFENADVDSIINGRKHNSLIPTNYLIEEIGVGEVFIEEYQRVYKIKKINNWPTKSK
jgi:hypothetical protein|tara:strand:+ start:196 stop:450 length:255 start_codon:yes stop_codon:yes gene_type:complete